jgi:endogenous inhibitor of DNA gyrase (YacG/DUF329 family)
MDNSGSTPKKKSADSSNVRTVRCPQCGRPAIYAPENPFRPFCSERCRLIDLGQWADETYRVPAETVRDHETSDDDNDNSQ